jgi:hypothetical protein
MPASAVEQDHGEIDHSKLSANAPAAGPFLRAGPVTASAHEREDDPRSGNGPLTESGAIDSGPFQVVRPKVAKKNLKERDDGNHDRSP